MQAVFVELPPFARQRQDYLDDEQFQRLQQSLLAHPEAGAVIENPDMKRRLFAELVEGLEALAAEREGKITLNRHTLAAKPAPIVTAEELVQLRQRLNLSRSLFARCLRTNERTLENWEQGRVRPNAQATLLIRLVERYPDTVERLATL